jgi:hypothetical protein
VKRLATFVVTGLRVRVAIDTFSALLASWNSIFVSYSSCGSTFCLPFRWREGAPSWRCCCIFLRNYSTSFLISQHSDVV